MLVQKKIDGVVLLSRNLGTFSPLKNVRISFPPIIRRQEVRKLLKGFRITRNVKHVWTIRLFEVNDFTVSLCIWGPAFILFPFLYAAFKSAIKWVLNELGSSSETTTRYNLSYVNDSSDGLLVYLTDFHKFGRLLIKKMFLNVSTATEFVDVECRIGYLAMATGQGAAFDYIARCLSILNFKYVSEMVTHVAYDYSLEDAILLWKRNETMKALGVGPSYEYYPSATCGLGNYYYHFRRPAETELEVTMVKFYNSINKHVHNLKGTPFKRAEISEFLWKYCCTSSVNMTRPEALKTIRCLKKYLHSCDLLDITTEQISSTQCYSRCELLVSTVYPAVNPLVLINEATDLYVNNYDLSRCSMFEIMQPNVLAERYRTYIIPASQLMRRHLSNALGHIQDGKVDICFFGSEDCLNVAAAEVIAGFFIYGIAVSTNHGRGHNNKICSDLGLSSAYLKSFTHWRLNDSGGTLPELGRLVNRNGRLENLIQLFPEFSYKPTFDITSFSTNAEVKNVYQMKTLVELMSLIIASQNPDETEVHFKNISVILLKVIIFSALTAVQVDNMCDLTFRKTSVSSYFKKCNVITSNEYVRWLNTTRELDSHTGIFWLIHQLNTGLGENYNPFMRSFLNQLDQKLENELCPLVFPRPKRKLNYIVLPSSIFSSQYLFVKFIKLAISLKYKTKKIDERICYFVYEKIRNLPRKQKNLFKGTDKLVELIKSNTMTSLDIKKISSLFRK